MSSASTPRANIPLEDSIPEAGASLESILCTEELQRRPSRPPDYEKENRALVALGSALADSPSTVLQTLAETILDVTQCDSAGLSLLTRDGKMPDVCGKRFYWPAIAGTWNPHVGGGTPRNFGPCGDVLDQNRTLLFRHFERRYPYLMPVIPAAEECLLVPFYVAGQGVGTIWAIMHSDRRKFDAEDDRVMASLGKFASSAYQALVHIEDLKFEVALREKAEAAVRELANGLEAKFRCLVDANIMGIFIWNLEGKIVVANEAFLHIVKYNREDLVSGHIRWTDLTPPEWRDRDERAVAELKALGIAKPYEKEYLQKGGNRVPVLVGGALFEQGGNEGVAFVLDLSEQKRAEEALRRSESYLAEAQRLTHTGSWASDGTTREALYWSEEMFRIFGFDPQQGLPMREQWLQRMHPEDRDKVKREASDRMFLQKVHSDVEYRIVLPDGTVKHIHGLAHPVFNSNRELVEVVGTAVDITEQKRAEEALRTSEAYLAEAQKLTHTGSWVWRVAGRDTLHLSEESYRVFGFDPAAGMPSWEKRLQRVHPEDRTMWQGAIERAIQQKAGYDIEFRVLLPDGTLKWVHTVGHPVLNASGDLVQFVGSSTDITERKRAEEKIRQSEKELRQLLDFTPQHVTVLGPDRSRLYNNKAALDYHGLTLEEWQTADPDRLCHPQDWQRIRREVYSKFRNGSSKDVEVRLRRRDGQYRWFLIRYNPTLDEQGRPTRWYAAATDIEDRKQAEQRLQDENVALREEIDRASMFEEIVGVSPALHAVLSRVSKVAPTDSTVLITGETGTGKELIARAVHKRSQRSSRAFVSVNCAAIPRDLIASELFGHEKGAFTGATQRRLGRFELAEGGTIFLDEIGELPAETQIGLLRVLQEHEFERVGGTGSIRTNVRVIAATNRDLQAAIAAGTFRSDLFYRLNVFPIEVPPLRERREDIPVLVEYFIDRYASKTGKYIRAINKKSLELLQSYPWPGNIREMQNVIERSVIVSDTESFSVDESWLSRQPVVSETRTQLELARKSAAKEKEIIEAALRESGGRVYGPSGAASKLGIPRSTLESKIRSLKISKSRFKAIDSSKNS